MDTIHARLLDTLKFLGRANVGRDHEFFDKFMAVKARTRCNGNDLTLFVQFDLALGNIKFQNATAFACLQEGVKRAIKRFDDRIDQRTRRIVWLPIHGALNLIIGQTGRRAHHPATELMSEFMAVFVEPHFNSHTAAVFMGNKRTPTV